MGRCLKGVLITIRSLL